MIKSLDQRLLFLINLKHKTFEKPVSVSNIYVVCDYSVTHPHILAKGEIQASKLKDSHTV